jgi:hypothetical protein
MRSRWLASFVVAFAVSWSFHEVDEHGDQKIERAQRISTCTIRGVAWIQDMGGSPNIAVILKGCEELEDKK